jgi:hypothetical protein
LPNFGTPADLSEAEYITGHSGEYRTQEKIERNYWWPRMGNQVKEYVRTCESCQRTKVHRYKQGSLHPHEQQTQPWRIIAMDLIGPLPMSNGNNAIQVFANTGSKAIHIEPVHMEINAEGVAKLLRDRVIRYHGVPEKIISDRDKRYSGNFMTELSKLLGIQLNTSTAYRPQTDGQTERSNQEIEQYLRIFINYHQTDWSDWLALAEFTYNDKINASTKTTPFFSMYGQHPWKGVEPIYKTKSEHAKNFASRMQKVRDEAAASLSKAQETMTKRYNLRRRTEPKFKVGDKVYVEATDIKQNRPSKKLSDKRVGPYVILEKRGEAAWKLNIPTTDRKYPVFNEELLTKYYEPPPHRTEERPAPEIIEDREEYEVEEILDHRRIGRGYQYYVKWKKTPVSEATWEPSRNLLPRAAVVLAEYIVAKNLPSPKSMSVRQVPIYKEGYWLDKYAKRFESKEETKEYPVKFLFLPRNGDVVPVEVKLPTDSMFVHKHYVNLKKTFNNNLLQREDESNCRDDDS